MITVLYDGACGLCNKEINHYIKIAKPNIFNWVNIMDNSNKNALQPYNLKLTTVLKSLHVVNANGTIYTGVDAFAIIWQNLGLKWRILARLVKLPLVYSVAKYTYKKFAAIRFAKLQHCQVAQSNNL